MGRTLLKICVVGVLTLVTDYGVASYLKEGLNLHYGFNNKASILCVGHSRSEHAIDKERLERGLGVAVAKYAVPRMDTSDRLVMIRHYFSEHPHQTKVVVYDVDFLTFNGKTANKNSFEYRQLYPFMENSEIDRYVRSRSSWSEYVSRKYLRSLRYNDPKVFAQAVINHFQAPKMPATAMNVEEYKKSAASQQELTNLVINPDNVHSFEQTIAFLKSQNVKIVLLFLPIIDLEEVRIRSDYRARVVEMLRKYAAGDADIMLIGGAERYARSYELFSDPLHLNRAGQRLVTDNLVRRIKPIIN